MRNYIVLLLALVLTTCSEVINLDTDQKGGELVIFGRISNSHLGNYVEVTRTNSAGQAPEPILNAVVRVYDEDGGSQL